MTARGSRTVAALIGLTAVLAGWLALAYGRMSDWPGRLGAEPGAAFAGFVGAFTAMRWATASAVIVLLVVTTALVRHQRQVAAGVTALLAGAVAAAFLLTPVPLTGDGFSAIVPDDAAALDASFLVATALAAGVALVSVLLAVAAWQMRLDDD